MHWSGYQTPGTGIDKAKYVNRLCLINRFKLTAVLTANYLNLPLFNQKLGRVCCNSTARECHDVVIEDGLDDMKSPPPKKTIHVVLVFLLDIPYVVFKI